jgi:cytochrome c biogenesis protein CcdA
VRDEVQLAKQELREKVSLLQSSMVMIGAGAAVGLVASLAICAAVIVGLAEFVGAWQSALIVGLALAVVAGVLVFVGLGRLKKNTLKPEQTIETLEEDKEWLKRLT